MATSSQSLAETASPVVRRVSVAKPSLLMAIYANPDDYPPTRNAVQILADDFRIRIVARNGDKAIASLPADVTIDRIGPAWTARALENASAGRKADGYLRYIAALRRVVAESQPRLIYAYDPIAFAAAMMVHADTPVVFHCHDVPELEGLSPLSLQSWLIRYALRHTRNAAAVVFPEKHRAEYWLAAAGDSRRPIIVPNGAARGFFDLPGDWTVFAAKRFAGRTALYYGWLSTANAEISAIRALAFATNTKLALMGSTTPDFDVAIRDLVADVSLQGKIELHSWSEHEKAHLLETSALGLVLYKPSSENWEFSGSAVNKLFEYAAAGLPVVVPDRLSYREFLAGEEWVAFAEIENPESIAAAINSILASRDRYVAMSRAARDAHEKRLNYEVQFATMLNQLLDLTRRES